VAKRSGVFKLKARSDSRLSKVRGWRFVTFYFMATITAPVQLYLYPHISTSRNTAGTVNP
jgi:hypothetical protein